MVLYTLGCNGLLKRNGTQVNPKDLLTPKQWEVMDCLVKCQGRMVARDELCIRVWGSDYPLRKARRNLQVLIGQIRKRMGPHQKELVTVHGMFGTGCNGYRLGSK